MRKKSLITKFQEFWVSLSNDERWDLWRIMTALRASDGQSTLDCSEDETLKALTTARIRGELFRGLSEDPMLTFGDCFESIAQAEEDGTQVLRRLIKGLFMAAPQHFRSHVHAGIDALQGHVSNKKTIRDLLKILDW